MNVLVRFVQKNNDGVKTLFNEFKLQNVLTQYREPIDEHVVRLLAAKMAFENDAKSVKTWFGNLDNKQSTKIKEEFEPIMKVIRKPKRASNR